MHWCMDLDNGSNFQRSVISEGSQIQYLWVITEALTRLDVLDEAKLVRRHGNVPPADYFLVAEVLDHILKKDGIPHEYVEELRNAVIKRNFEGPFTALKMNVPENKCEAAQVALQKLKVFPWKGHTFTADQKEGTLILTRNGLDSVSIPIDIQGVA
ncbi:hypothetical protein H0H93_015878 [Arthromyces matolae]|nr:hypothetical protein H0H93_015878 [Arthromyces matolae]